MNKPSTAEKRKTKQPVADSSKQRKKVLDVLSNNHQPRPLSLSNADGEHLINICDILYCKTIKQATEKGNMASRLLFRIVDGREIIVSNGSLTLYEKILKDCLVIKISQSVLVNMKQVKIYRRKQGEIIMKGYNDKEGNHHEKEFSISRSQRKYFDLLYHQYAVCISGN